MRQSGWFFDTEPWPIYIAWEGKKIDFTGGVKLKSGTKTPEIQGTENEEITNLDLLLPQLQNIVGWIRRIYIDQRLTHQDFFGLKGVQIPTRPKLIANQVTSAC